VISLGAREPFCTVFGLRDQRQGTTQIGVLDRNAGDIAVMEMLDGSIPPDRSRQYRWV
jgi:hypothetical protein